MESCGLLDGRAKLLRDIRMRFGRAIRRIREERKANQKESTERFGLHRTYDSGVERGVRNVPLVNIEKVAADARPVARPNGIVAGSSLSVLLPTNSTR